jgi:DNA-binding PadR family transcriptional regulator
MSDPLKPADFHILLALLERERHGYEIMKEVERESRDTVRLEVGTLYRILARLLDDGLLQEAGDDGRRRKYRLTQMGRRVVKAEAERLAGVVDRLRARKLLPHGEI